MSLRQAFAGPQRELPVARLDLRQSDNRPATEPEPRREPQPARQAAPEPQAEPDRDRASQSDIRTLTVGDEDPRRARVYSAGPEGSADRPALLMPYGLGGTPEGLHDFSRVDATAEARGVVTVYPEGRGATWRFEADDA